MQVHNNADIYSFGYLSTSKPYAKSTIYAPIPPHQLTVCSKLTDSAHHCRQEVNRKVMKSQCRGQRQRRLQIFQKILHSKLTKLMQSS